MKFKRIYSATILLLTLPASAQSVLIVDKGGAGGFTTIQSAIDAAADGDLVLIKPGTYLQASIDGKGLTLIADGPGVLIKENGSFKPGVYVANLPADRFVNIAGLSGERFLPGYLMRINNCAGPIQLNDCSFAATKLPGFSQFEVAAVDIVNSGAVTLVDSTLDASPSNGNIFGTGLQDGLVSTRSNVFVHGCTILSGKAAQGDTLDPPGGGTDGLGGWTVVGGFGLGVRTVCQGAEGGDGNVPQVPPSPINCGPGGDGGPGLLLIQAGPIFAPEDPMFVRSSMTLIPGVGGSAALALCLPGVTAPALSVEAGSLINDDFATRAFDTEYLARVGSIKSETFIGEPFDLVWHVFGVKAAMPVFVPELTGAPTVGAPFFFRFRGLINGSGQKTVNLIVPEIGIDFVTIYEEAYFYDGIRFYLSNPQFSVLLDDAL